MTKDFPIAAPRHLLHSLFFLLLPCCANAQSSVTMYGYLDIGLVKQSGNSAGIDRGYNNWLGFHGKESLGNGTNAIFRLETRFYPDTGQIERPQTFWQGESTVGLQNEHYGTVRLGRALTPMWDAAWQFEPWVNSGFNASLASYQTGSYSTDGVHDSALGFADATRISQGIYYNSPTWHGFSVNTAIKASKDPDASTRVRSVALYYSGKQGSTVISRETNARSDDITYLAGKYKLQSLTLMASWSHHHQTTTADERMWLVAGTYEFGSHMLRTGYGKNKNNGQQKLSGGYVHRLSKRTSLYADLYRERKIQYQNGIALGMTHSF